MGSSDQQKPDFESVKARLSEIADVIDDESLSLDDALDLYEEAVALGLQASDLLETGVVVPEGAENDENAESASAENAAEGTGDAESEGESNGEKMPDAEGDVAGAGSLAR